MLAQVLGALGRLFDGLKFFVFVLPWEQAIRIRWGKYVSDLEPGFAWKWPVLDRVKKASVRERSANLSRQPLWTLDRQLVSVCASLQWEILSLRTMYETSQHPEDTLRNRARARIADYVARTELVALAPARIAEQVQADLEAELEPYGIGVLELLIVELAQIPALRLVGDGDDSSWGGVLDTEDEPPQQGAA